MDVASNEKQSTWNDDAFATLTIEECKKEFELCENDIDRFVDQKEKLALLRSCTVLLNRLENTSEDLFAGRVLIFLARAIHLFDQSGVNLKSEFSSKQLPRSVVKNLQEISIKNSAKDQQIALMIDRDMEEGETLSDDDDSNDSPDQNSSTTPNSSSNTNTNNNNNNHHSKHSASANSNSNHINGQTTTTTTNSRKSHQSNEDAEKLYERFWKMQQYLDQPNLIYDKNSWLTFRTQLATFVARMEHPTKMKAWNLNSNYMTEPKSFCLQLNDINMRRCFLVQLLIILQYFELPVESRSSDLIMDRVHLDWSSKLSKKIYSILGTLPNQEEGRRFLGLVKHLLKREEIWNCWKNEKCKEPKEPEEDDEIVMMGSTYHKRRKISDELRSAESINWHIIGSQVMSRLWNMKQDQKFHQPALNAYLNIPLERQSESFKDPNVSFRLLRLLRRSPDFFTQTTNPIQSLDEYLKSIAKTVNGKEEAAAAAAAVASAEAETETATSSQAPTPTTTTSTPVPTTPTTIESEDKKVNEPMRQ